MFRSLTIVSIAAVLLTACTDKPDPLDLDDTGVVRGLIYVDRDGNEQLTPNFDVSATGATASLVRTGSGDTVATAIAGIDGTFFLRDVPVGEYNLLSGRGILGDTLELQDIDTVRVLIASGDTLTRMIRYGFPSITVAAARMAVLNRRVVVRGVALNTLGSDTMLHIQDPTGAIRATRVQPASAIQAGDSIRMVGVISNSNGRPIIDLPLTTVIAGARPLAPPDSLSTARAATADAGRLVDQRVRIAHAEVVDTATLPFYYRVTLDDGSGRVEVLYRFDQIGPVGIPLVAAQLGARVTIANGLLVAGPAGNWQIKPRAGTDVTAVFPNRTIADVRALPQNKRVQISGIALNRFRVFNDSTIHLQDATGAIRTIRITNPLNGIPDAGDSLRVLATTAIADGRPVLLDATVTYVSPGQRGVLTPDSVSTQTAATAGDGTRADSHVRIANATIRDTASVVGGNGNGDLILYVNDGSGEVEVYLSRFVAFDRTQAYIPGGIFKGAGLLVPGTGTAWRIKPRLPSESSIRFETKTVADIRALPINTPAFVDGIALNNSAAFGDSTVHLQDRTGAIRTVRVLNIVNGGDSVRFNGITAVSNGQPVLTNVRSSVLRAGVGVPAPDSISLTRVRTADGGALDARLVRAVGIVIGVETLTSQDVVVTLESIPAAGATPDTAEVLFKRVNGTPGSASVGTIMKVTGLLVPTGTGSWRLQPRNTGTLEVESDFREVTIAEARMLDIGKTVYIRGIALNAWRDFNDASIHIKGVGGAIRVVNHPQIQISAGDSVKIRGETFRLNGQIVLIGSASGSTILRSNVGVPRPDTVATNEAASALNGVKDADGVAISGNITAVDSTTTGPTSDLTFTVNDGTGPVKVVIDRDLGLVTGAFVKNTFVRVRGLLIPDANTGKWLIKPRSPADIGVATPPAPPEPPVRGSPQDPPG